MRRQKTHQKDQHLGFTLIESALSLFVLSIMIAVFGNFVVVRTTNRQTSLRAQAAALVDEQISALRQAGFSALPASGTFRRVLYPAGGWQVVAEGTAGHTSPNVVELSGNTSIPSGLSGRLLFPAGIYDAATLEAKWKVASDSTSGWQFGYFFHALDNVNGYRLRIGATGTDLDGGANDAHNIYLEKVTGGTSVSVWGGTSTVNIANNTWYTLRIVLTPSGTPTIRVYLNGTAQDPNNISDTTWTSGAVAAIGYNGVHAYLDDPQTIVNGVTSTWNFDTNTDLPAAWLRFGLNTLPDTTPNVFDDNGTLAITAYPSGSTTLKQVVAQIQWSYGTSVRTYSSTVLIGNAEIGL